MNKYYFLTNLIDSIDRIFLPYYSEKIYRLFLVIFILSCVSTIAGIILAKKNLCKSSVLFYTTLIFASAVISTAFVFYISIPFTIYINQLLLFYYTKETNDKNIKKSIVLIITVAFAIITLIMNGLCL